MTKSESCESKVSNLGNLQKAHLDEIARKHGLATMFELEQLKKNTDCLIASLKERKTYNPKELCKDLVRYRLSKTSNRILKEIKKVTL